MLAGVATRAETSFLAKSLRIGLELQETCKLRPLIRREALSHVFTCWYSHFSMSSFLFSGDWGGDARAYWRKEGGWQGEGGTQAACLLEASVTPCLSQRPSGARGCRSAAVDLLSIQNVLWPSWFSVTSIFFLALVKTFRIFCMAARDLCCCTRAFSSCGEQELSFTVVCGLLTAVASLVVEHGL